MQIIPDPKRLVELAHSAGRLIEDREWKQYQRYLAKLEQQHTKHPEPGPLRFEEFCALRQERRKNAKNIREIFQSLGILP